MASNYDGLPLDLDDVETKIMVDTAIQWVADNTTIDIDPEAELPSNVKLFVIKFCDTMSTSASGIASESLGGMSQSFATSMGASYLLRDLAYELFGAAYGGRNRFVVAQNRWR